MIPNVPGDDPSSEVRERQITIMTQLLKAVTAMYSIDEMFQWLSYAFVQHFDLELVQFWTPVINETGMLSTHLRMMISRDPSLPGQFAVNDQVVQVARRITFEQRATFPAQTVSNLFSLHQATLLQRCNLNYCCGGFMNSNVLLPAPRSATHARGPAPFALTHLLFLARLPHRDLILTINVVLKQAVELAVNRRLLLPVPVNSPPASLAFAQSAAPETPLPIVQELVPPLNKLVPRRREDADLMVSSNPFARAAGIADKQARRVHAAIDGHMDIGELCKSTGMDIHAMAEALRTLVQLHRVELYDAHGNPVNPQRAFKGYE